LLSAMLGFHLDLLYLSHLGTLPFEMHFSNTITPKKPGAKGYY